MIRRYCFGTRPSPFAENDHFEAEIAPLPTIVIVLRRKEQGDPPPPPIFNGLIYS